MGIFGNKTKKLIEELRRKSEYHSNDLSKEIQEVHEDLKADYEENSLLVPEFQEFVAELKTKLEMQDAQKLEEFSKRLAKVHRTAENCVNSVYQLSYNQKKITAETLREYEEFE